MVARTPSIKRCRHAGAPEQGGGAQKRERAHVESQFCMCTLDRSVGMLGYCYSQSQRVAPLGLAGGSGLAASWLRHAARATGCWPLQGFSKIRFKNQNLPARLCEQRLFALSKFASTQKKILVRAKLAAAHRRAPVSSVLTAVHTVRCTLETRYGRGSGQGCFFSQP